MAASFAEELTGPRPLAANFFAVPGSSERARDTSNGIRDAIAPFLKAPAFSMVYE
jgi:hypothetical protein